MEASVTLSAGVRVATMCASSSAGPLRLASPDEVRGGMENKPKLNSGHLVRR